MIDVLVTQGPRGWKFQRDFVRRYIELAGSEGVFSKLQLRAIASMLHVPEDEDVQFLDKGTFETLGVISSCG